ncbi:hypothetical protein [Streptomyces caniscabiei]|uniref:hypothetical protein n=1 Tax=Streptomyces caniscabiei TaxID=2746961 RepID=UPI0029C068AC|nr:hypothetical protein [Streptomyces caniscabiei]
MESNSGLSSGLTTADAQHAICQGVYGDKEWTAAEREAACQRYEQIINERNNPSQPDTAMITGVAIAAVLIIAVLAGYFAYRRKRNKQKIKRTK